ncbi:transposase [Streptomyces mobaraensis NBRC 13819 = DSM 40847]|uniref:ISXo8 transposase n=1 Tax=Streptomyces mobaraensis (strain ATCC 29032 / DSM 40847 / JCM 4168 / NBRC 13819 / NCIMB 11159 / IPCR 16-22) TaxID=1223523 RepID=M3A1E5_STRM1|nr:transposase [Streptomyces mobaraensis]EME98868.1 ISXo8 transposase [Streptomyces mobaraensis NBRC 13819 = DSM 40847]QTT76140.1 transposase [Streptomyces mobaraensis NBRC 13819 = DSM 40847]
MSGTATDLTAAHPATAAHLTAAVHPATVGRRAPAPGADAREPVFADLSASLFASLPRADQRRRGEAYLRGLLGARGRKSIRNIAAQTGGPAAEQSLHHFVAASPWDWGPVRRELAHYVARAAPPQAWVVRPMTIPKVGDNSVGVERRFCPDARQVLNSQQAVGVWAAAPDLAVPVGWRLHLSGAWLDDPARRRQAGIPDSVTEESWGECAVEAFTGMTRGWGLPARPVVLDAREADTLAALPRLRAVGVPVLARVGGSLRLTLSEPTLPGRGGTFTAQHVMAAARDLRRPVLWRDGAPGAPRAARTALTAAVRVGLPVARAVPGAPVRRREMLLLGIGDGSDRAGRWPAELWLTDLLNVPPAALVRLTRLPARVDRDFHEIGDRVGLRDFAGRSFGGWHRHTTLASAAHAVVALARRPEAGEMGDARLERVS